MLIFASCMTRVKVDFHDENVKVWPSDDDNIKYEYVSNEDKWVKFWRGGTKLTYAEVDSSFNFIHSFSDRSWRARMNEGILVISQNAEFYNFEHKDYPFDFTFDIKFDKKVSNVKTNDFEVKISRKGKRVKLVLVKDKIIDFSGVSAEISFEN